MFETITLIATLDGYYWISTLPCELRKAILRVSRANFLFAWLSKDYWVALRLSSLDAISSDKYLVILNYVPFNLETPSQI
jgi:hypothetical protein